MSRIIVESLPHIDVNELNRLGAFARPMEFPFMALRTSRYLIEYRPQSWPAGRVPQRIRIQWTWCTYGGSRPWFTCLCGRRVGKLYHGNGCLGCRHCAEATYELQRKSRRGRLHLKAVRLRAKFGDYGRPGIDAFPPRLPWFRGQGMQRKTYAWIRARAEFIERQLIDGGLYRPSPRRQRRNYAFRS